MASGETSERPIGSGVLLSIVLVDAEDVGAWYERLRDRQQVEILSQLAVPGVPVHSFFLRDPGGYRVEIQAFTDSLTADRLRNSS